MSCSHLRRKLMLVDYPPWFAVHARTHPCKATFSAPKDRKPSLSPNRPSAQTVPQPARVAKNRSSDADS